MYKQAHYIQVLDAVTKEYKLRSLPDWQWIAWRVSIKRLFDQGISIREILAAIPEAGEKRKWPGDAKFWKRVEDIVYLHRKNTERIVTVDSGMSGLRDLLTSKPNLPHS